MTDDKDNFECLVAKQSNRRYAIACQHADYMSILAVMSEKHKRCLKPGQEVILSTIGTSLPLVLELGLTPVFVDVDIPTFNALPCLVEEAVTENTGAIFLQHTLGNPIAIQYISDRILEGSYIWGIFDCGASIGGTCTGTYDGQPIGNFGDLSIFSFRNNGVVLTDSPYLDEILRKLCHCKYSLEPIPNHVQVHRENWKYYHEVFKSELSEYFVLPEPHHMADPNWQGFCVLYQRDRERLLQYLKKNGVKANQLPVQNYKGYKLVGTAKNTNKVQTQSFWIDISRTNEREYVVDTIKKGCKL
jgi:dTDP-4-amino-4,6-dideoxygalactose transaminase